MTTLTLVRHGETDWNRAHRIQGATDIPLNETGRAQARATGELLRASLPGEGPVRVDSSDLSRAHETAQIIARVLGAPEPRTYPQLRERRYGEAEGMSIGDFPTRWRDMPMTEIPGAETWEQVRERALAGVAKVVADATADDDPPVSLIVVSHGALIREVIRAVTDGRFPAEAERLPNGSAHTFDWNDGALTLRDYSAVPV